ncbi:microtubule-associated protein futsch isoform X2 [Rhopalosiphum maidis]|uniref:microtubule-associated protein futsch isoform X2 n=1 Tax=Rhopalosiphum maidis TaxID=43146 RepID=UPI000EFDC1C7|nr:microtubule-associated protein futsch isoform X2 [Rhopalosiphum maidis]
MGNPSDHVETPLTGGYLLIVLAEPRSAEHKLAILKKLTKGLSCWNYEESGVEIVTELNAIVNQNIEGEEGKNGEQLFQYVSDNLVAEILINPQHSTLVQCVRNLLASFTKYRCIIHAGYSFTENGSWILQDGSFSVTDFLDAYKTAEAQRTIRLHENNIRIDLHCSADADWNQVSRVKGTRFLLNPPEKIVDNESIESTVRWLCDKIEVVELDTLLEGSQVVGNIRFSRPTLYVFPAGQGDSALFGINGFNMLIDGGAGRNSCFWGFARHLDRLDAVLLTRLNSSNLEGVASFLKRKTMSSLYPQIGHFFCNFKTRKQISSPNIDDKQDVLSISLIDTAQSIITDLKQLQLRPHLCYRNINLEPINLYHKVGHGKLDMYVLNPSKDSKEVKDFLTKWNEGDQKLFNPTKDLQFPLPNVISVCTLLVWQPANPNTTITRILFPGSSPQNKIFESLERVRHLEFLKHPSCSLKSMSSATSVTVKSQTTKKTVLEKMIPGETKTIKTTENLEVSTSASNSVIQTAIIPTVPKEGTPRPKFPVEAEKPKPNVKTVIKETTNTKSKVEHKYSSISAKVNSNKVVQKSTTTRKTLKLSSKSPPTDKSSPTTPIENQDKAPKTVKQVIKPKSTTNTTKSPLSTPTKSKKEEANRKVLVSSRTNSGLKRTPITKKETKPANPISTEIGGVSLKKDSNIVYKSSLISCDKDKSGEEEDILIVEKVAITPEKLLTPDGKKIIANELDGILTTAKDIVIKEKCIEKLSDSGATTAPTMPEDEKTTESKKENEINESDKKIEEDRKAKDALKTPDEVADLPFHEEADEHKKKVTEKEFDTEIETQEIVQVENAEYVLVSLDSSPEALKRQVLDTVNLLDAELDEDSDKEDENVETKQSKKHTDIDEKTKLIEHLLESSKDLCEITDKLDELKKQNKHEATNHQIHDHLQTYYHENNEKTTLTTKVSIGSESITNEQKCIPEKSSDKQDSKASSKASSVCDDPVKSPVHETIKSITKVTSRSGSITEEQESIPDKINEKQHSKVSSNEDSVSDEPVKSPIHETTTSSTKTPSRSESITNEKESIPDKLNEKQDSKASSKAGSVCDEPVKSPVHETTTSSTKAPSRSESITIEQEIIPEKSSDKQDSKAPSKAGSICDEPVKSPVHETTTSSTKAPSRSESITNEKESIPDKLNEKQDSKASSKAGSVCDEPVKSPIHETTTSSTKTPSRSESITNEKESIPDKLNEKQDSKASSKAGSVCDEPVESPVHETINSITKVTSRSGSITEEQESIPDKLNEKQDSKASSKAGSVCDEPVKSPIHETTTSSTKTPSRSESITIEQEIIPDKLNEKQDSKASSKAGSVCDEPVKSPIHETTTSSTKTPSRSESITNEKESIPDKLNEKQDSKASSKAGSVCDEPVKSPVHESTTSSTKAPSRSESITIEQEIIPEKSRDKQDSKAPSKAGSVCDEPVKSPVHESTTSSTKAPSRSESITIEQESIPDKLSKKQDSNSSSKAGSVCDEPVKSPIHETTTSSTKTPSRSESITNEKESIPDKLNEKQDSKASSKAGSVCDEPVKSPVHETTTSSTKAPSRSESITNEKESIPDKLNEKQDSKASSKAGSVCDEPVKSPVHESTTSSTKAPSRSESITIEQEIIPEKSRDKQDSKAPSKAGSVCDEPVKSPVHESTTSSTKAPSRSESITIEQEIIPEKSRDKQDSKAPSKAGSVCDEPVKSPVHETTTTSTKAPSRSESITIEQEIIPEKSSDKQDLKASSKAGSVCDEPIESPVHEIITSITKVTSRSGSITIEQEIIPDKLNEKQDSKASSKAGSVCDEPVKSPIHETTTSSTKTPSRSESITNEKESIPDKLNEKQDSKASSKAGSVCDEPVKSPVHETTTSSTKAPSRSESITIEQEIIPEKSSDKQDSKASSKAGSVCDEPVKSPVHETTTSSTKAPSRSESITIEQEIIPDKLSKKQDSNSSSKAGSVCDEPVKSPVHETTTSSTKAPSRSESITNEKESIPDKLNEKQDSKASSKAGSVCDEPIESPVHEIITSISKVTSRSGSITEEQESIPEKSSDKQDLKTSSKAGSVCDESVKSPVHETTTSSSKAPSRSESITIEQENIPDKLNEKLDSKTSSKAGSVCDELVKSPIHETITSTSYVTSISGSITVERETIPEKPIDKHDSRESYKAASVCDDVVKSQVHESIKVISGSDSITDEHECNASNEVTGSVSDEPVISSVHKRLSSSGTTTSTFNLGTSSNKVDSSNEEITYVSVKDNHEPNTFNNGVFTSIEPIDIHFLEKNSKKEVIACSTNSKDELLKSVSCNNNCSTVDNISSDISFKEQESVSKLLISKNIPICLDTESTPISDTDKYDVETCSSKDSFSQDKNESATVSSSSISSICQEVNTQSSKLSSRKSSVIDESIDKPLKLQIGEKSSSLQETNIYEPNIDDNNTKIFIKSGSLCDELLNMSFNKATENVISNKTYEQAVSSTSIAEYTESKMEDKVESVCEEPIKTHNDDILIKENSIPSTPNSILLKTEEEKCQPSSTSSLFDETQKLQIENNEIILSPSDNNKNNSNVIEKKVKESKSLGRIGSLCEEIAKFLTDDDKKMSTNITSESPCSIPLKTNIEELKVKTESFLHLDKNTNALNMVDKSLQPNDEVKVNEKRDNINEKNEKNTDHSLPAENITISNIKSPDISTLLIEENNKTGIMNVAQIVGKNINDHLTKHTDISDNESKILKTVIPISSITSEECISKSSNVLIEDVVKVSDEKNIINNSSLTHICVNQPLGVTLNSEDLGVTKEIVMQLKRDVHEALHQCSSDDERPFTPHSESSMSRSAMNIDDDDDDNEYNKIETDDDMAGSPMSTGPSPIQMQLDNRQVEINMDFNKAIQEHRITRGEDLTTTETNGNLVTEIKTTEHDNINQNQGTSSDTVQSWGKPLGLPPVQSINNNGFDPIREWGKPLGLPSPTQPVLELGETQNMSSKTTPKKSVKKIIDNKPIINVMDKDAQNRIRRSESPSKLRSRSSSRMSRINPVYLDLIYVPHHGNSKYVSADFFKRVRARNYVFSGTDPSKEVLNALIEGKQAWEDQDLEVTIIPTYDTDTLGQWVAENEELLTKLKIDLSPSASRCTIKLQDHNTSCSAYRLEF